MAVFTILNVASWMPGAVAACLSANCHASSYSKVRAAECNVLGRPNQRPWVGTAPVGQLDGELKQAGILRRRKPISFPVLGRLATRSRKIVSAGLCRYFLR
jgi:hypothetical protein